MRTFTPIGELFLDPLLDCQCAFCWGKPLLGPAKEKALRAIERLLKHNPDLDPQALHVLRMLVRSSQPILGRVFQNYLDLDDRAVKATMRELRDEWLLPICATRQKPFGYFIAATAEQFLAWMRTTRTQAISELATAQKLFRTNFPELAGQQSLDFVNTVSTELQEAIQ